MQQTFDQPQERPWIVATTDPDAATDLRAHADRVAECVDGTGGAATVAAFSPGLHNVCVLAELFAKHLPRPATRNTEAKRDGVMLYLVGEVATPVETLIKLVA